MATLHFPIGGQAIRVSGARVREQVSGRTLGAAERRRKKKSGPSVLVVCAYFLGLASIAVVAVGGQFPWFILAPLAVLLSVAHFRRMEAAYARKSSRHGGKGKT